MDPAQLAGTGAFLSGIGSVIGGYFTLRHVRHKADSDCKQRIEEMRREFIEGLERGLKIVQQRDETAE